MMALVMAVALTFLSAVGLCLRALTLPKTATTADNPLKIVLDAGHGGMDGGVAGKITGVKESEINLAIVIKTARRLRDLGFEVVLTRKTEEGLYGVATRGFKKRDMQARKQIVQDAKPALLVSVHQNFYPTKTPRGAQVFYRKKDESSKNFADFLQTSLNHLYEEQGVKNRKTTAGEYFMLDCGNCPSVIVECGFLSNAQDERLLISENFQERIAQSITAGIIAYLSA